MRIALIHHAAPPVVGGVERVVGHHARLMAAAGHEVTVIAGRGGLAGRGLHHVREPLVDSLHPEVVAISRELERGVIPPMMDVLVDRLEGILAPIIRATDIVISHNVASLNKNLALTAALHRLSQSSPDTRFVLWHHDLAWALPRYRPSLHDAWPWDLLRTAWPGVVQVVISQQRRQDLVALTGLPEHLIEVVPNGVDVPMMLGFDHRTTKLLRSARVLDAEPLLLMPARIVPRKNIELGIRVVSALRTMGRPAGLVVTGPVDPHDHEERGYLAMLRDLAQELRVTGSVWFPGAANERGLADPVVADLYALADALFLPSREEGFGIPVLEALLHRLPIICSDLPVLREVADTAATYVNPDDDPGAIAAVLLERLDGDPSLAAAARVRRTSSWEAIDQRWIRPLLIRLDPGATPVP